MKTLVLKRVIKSWNYIYAVLQVIKAFIANLVKISTSLVVRPICTFRVLRQFSLQFQEAILNLFGHVQPNVRTNMY